MRGYWNKDFCCAASCMHVYIAYIVCSAQGEACMHALTCVDMSVEL